MIMKGTNEELASPRCPALTRLREAGKVQKENEIGDATMEQCKQLVPADLNSLDVKMGR